MLGGAMVTQGLSDLLNGSPQQHAQQRAADAAQAAAQKREDQRRERLKAQLLGEPGPDRSDGLSLMGTSPGATLQLVTGAQAMAPMGSPSVSSAAPPAYKHKPKYPDAFNKGYRDASNCYSQSIGTACFNISDPACAADYRAGFSVGDHKKQLKIDAATTLGRLDREAGKPNKGLEAVYDAGDCRNELDEAYTTGYGEKQYQRN